jgi:hypothetical protein
MTFAELAQKIIGEATTPDPRGLKTSSAFVNPIIGRDKDKGLKAGVDRPGAGNTLTAKMLRNIFRLLKNGDMFPEKVNKILMKYAGRQTVSKEYEDIVSNNISAIQDNETKLIAYKTALTQHETGKAVLSDPKDVQGKIKKLEDKIKAYKAGLKQTLAEIEKFPIENQELEHNLREELISVVKTAAASLLKELEKTPSGEKSKPTKVKSLDELDKLITSDEELKQNETKIAVLKSLTEETPEKNALLRFFQAALNNYNEFMGGRQLSGKLATIEQNKQFNMLPMSAFERFYTANVRDANAMSLLPVSAGAKALQAGMAGSQAGKKLAQLKDPNLMAAKKLLDPNFESGDRGQGVAAKAKGLVKLSNVGPRTMEKLYKIIDDIISGVDGSPAAFARYVYGQEPVTESFNSLVEQYLTEAKKGARCTKVTGQQSSSRSSKKYMRCVRVDGKLKRIHYGDPKLRIKKSNPKKRKSFRARHKCSSAKPGTAKYYSCKNW